jgi:hypothetical protein
MTQQMNQQPVLRFPSAVVLRSSHNPTSCPRLKTQHSEETLSLTDPPTHRHTDPSARHHKLSQSPITDSTAAPIRLSLSCTHPTTDHRSLADTCSRCRTSSSRAKEMPCSSMNHRRLTTRPSEITRCATWRRPPVPTTLSSCGAMV